jgi:hypothetical protein
MVNTPLLASFSKIAYGSSGLSIELEYTFYFPAGTAEACGRLSLPERRGTRAERGESP